MATERTAAEVIHSWITRQIVNIRDLAPEARKDAPDAVHQMRVASRRLRTAFGLFARQLDAERIRPVRKELRWLGSLLGAPRDAEVLREHLLDAVASLPGDAIVGPITTRVRDVLDDRHEQAHRLLVTGMDQERFQHLLSDLDALLHDSPCLAKAARPARKLLLPLLEKTEAAVWKRAAHAARATGHDRLLLAHETRKKAKAARYAWEACESDIAGAEASAAVWRRVTNALGTIQDSVVARAQLLDLAERARTFGESEFSYGVLYQLEAERSERADRVAQKAITAALAGGVALELGQ